MRPQSSPISEMDATDDMHEALFAKRGCCFLMPCLASSQPSTHGGSVWWQRMRTPDERWWIRGWRKMREWSELVAGPRWKTFIRRFGRNHCCGGGGGGGGNPNRSDHGKFQYDPLSYSLNLDDGKQTGHFDDEFPYRDYSMRFAAPSLPVSTKAQSISIATGISECHALDILSLTWAESSMRAEEKYESPHLLFFEHN